MRNTILTATVVSLLMSFSSSLIGQDDDKPARPIREQSIYIPYEKLQETFEKEGRGVFVPYERFQELWKAARASQVKRPESTAPVKAMITEISSRAAVETDVVRVQATVKIDLLEPGWLTIPIRLADAAVLAATVDGEPARLVPHQGGQALLLKKDEVDAEQIELKLEYAKAFTKAPGQNSVSFQAPVAPVNRWEIRIPDEGVKVNVHPMLATTEIPDGNDQTSKDTVVLAFVGAAPQVKIDWTPKSEGATGLEALVGVQTLQRLVVDEGIARTYTTLSYDISRAELSQLRLEVPGDQKVVNVLDANVRGWSVEKKGAIQLVIVDLFQPAQKRQQLAIELERFRDATQQSEVVAPVVKAIDVGRQRGVVELQVRSGLRAEAIRREGLSQMAAAETSVQSNQTESRRSDASYRYAALPFDLAFQVEKVQPRIVVDQLAEAVLQPRQIDYWLTLKYDIQKAGVFELECLIPAGFEVRSVQGAQCESAVPAVVESFAKDPDDPTKLRVNLGNKAEGQVGLSLHLSRELSAPNLLTPTGQSEAIAFSPPRATGELVVRSTGRMLVYAPESLRLTLADSTGLRSISVSEASQPIPPVAVSRMAVTGLRASLAYAFSGEGALANLNVERRQPHVTARQLLVAHIDPGVVRYEATLDFEVRYSGVAALRVDLPDAVAQKFRNETRALRDEVMEPAPDDVSEGYTAVQLSGDTEFLGKQRCKLTWEEPIDDLNVGKSVDLEVPVLIPRNVARADGQVVLVKAETIDVRPKDVSEGVDPIDPEVDLMSGAKIPNAAAALEFRDSDWELTLTATRYQLENLKHTSIEQGMLRMVITRSDRVAVQALYRMRSNMQRLEIELPYDVEPGKLEFDTQPLRINGRAVTLERGDGPRTFFVPLVGFATNEPFLLELRYTMPGDGGQLRYPFFPNEPATQRVNLVAFLPQERDLIGRSGPWSAEMAWRTGDFLQRRYLPKHNVRQLIATLHEGISVMGNPVGDFPVQGAPLLFTTLRPQHPDDGALELKTVDRKVLDAIVLVSCLTLGVTLLSQTYATRFIVTCGGLGASILLGVFAPTLAGQVLDQTLLIALILVALLWLSVSVLQGVKAWKNRPRPVVAMAGAGTVAAVAAPPPKESEPVPPTPASPDKDVAAPSAAAEAPSGQTSASPEAASDEAVADSVAEDSTADADSPAAAHDEDDQEKKAEGESDA